mgnify:FL=1
MSSLFLDRDGVINQRIVEGYVTKKENFVLIDGVLEALEIFNSRFDHIFMVTNQQGIGKGLMSVKDLNEIHEGFMQQVTAAGGRIDKIYFCPSLKTEHSFMRKPSIGMALQAKHDYLDVRLKESVMVGDTESDMLFGRRAGMSTVLVGDSKSIATNNPFLVDYYYSSLKDFALSLLLTPPKGGALCDKV